MAISTYTELTNAIYSSLDVSTEDLSAVISNIVLEGENRIMRELRTPDMETALSVNISAGTASVPSDFIEMKYAYIDANPVQYVQMVPAAYIYDRYPNRVADGIPKVMARDGASFLFGPYPGSDYVVKGTYYKHLTAVASSVTNALFTANPDLYLFACNAAASLQLGRDARVAIWEQKYRFVKDLVMSEAQGSRLGGNLSIRVG